MRIIPKRDRIKMALGIDVSTERLEGLSKKDLVGIFSSEMVKGDILRSWSKVGWSKAMGYIP